MFKYTVEKTGCN